MLNIVVVSHFLFIWFETKSGLLHI